MRPRLLDLYCCQGGAAAGYHRAGFDVVGVDTEPQPRYPFEFIQSDALTFLREHGREFDVVHASPPCQDHSSLRHAIASHGTGWLLAATLAALGDLGRPYVVENVPGAAMPDPLILCGSMFGLGAECFDGWRQLRRHRLFSSNVPIAAPSDCRHTGLSVGVYGNGGGSYGHRLDDPRRTVTPRPTAPDSRCWVCGHLGQPGGLPGHNMTGPSWRHTQDERNTA